MCRSVYRVNFITSSCYYHNKMVLITWRQGGVGHPTTTLSKDLHHPLSSKTETRPGARRRRGGHVQSTTEDNRISSNVLSYMFSVYKEKSTNVSNSNVRDFISKVVEIKITE